MADDPRRGRLVVVHVVRQMDVGGMEKLLVEFARLADRNRFHLRFISLTGRGRLAGDLEALGWPVTALGAGPGLRPALVPRLAWSFRRLGADVVHAHNTQPLIYAGPAARLARIPAVVATRHGQGPPPGRQFFLMKMAMAAVDRVACVSEDSERVALRQGVPARKLVTIRNGIDLSRFTYQGPAAGGPVVMVGRLSPEKDVATLLRAVALAAREEPEFRLEVAGDGACRADLEMLAAELELGDHVRFLGEVRDVPALLARASGFALSSRTEGISLTLLEAMARGLPVAAARVGGNPEVVADGETGILVPAGSPSDLAAAMLRLHREPEGARRMGAAGRGRVEQLFDVRRMVAEYEAMYREIVARRGAPRPGRLALPAETGPR